MIGTVHGLEVPRGWKVRSLWSVATRSKESGKPDADPLSVYLQEGVVPRSSRGDNHNQLGEDLAKYLVVRQGDLVFNKLRTWQGGLGVSKYSGIVSPAYYVCRPGPECYPRFLHYLLRSASYLSELTRISKWMPPSQFDTPWDLLRNLPILLPPLEEQRRIADFLEAEISTIDRMLVIRERQVELVDERSRLLRDKRVQDLLAEWGSVPLRRHVRSIEQGVSPQCDAVPAGAGEFGVLKLSSVKRGMFIPSENKRLPDTEIASLKNLVRQGDLLVTRANTPDLVGDVAVVDQAERLLLPDLIYRVNPAVSVSASYVAEVLLGGQTRSLVKSVARGSSQSMVKLRGEDIRDCPIPSAERNAQDLFVAEMSAVRSSVAALRDGMDRQRGLLQERRQALITAAVAGKIDVTTVRGVDVS